MSGWTLGANGVNANTIYDGREPIALVYGLWINADLTTIEEAARLSPAEYAEPLARARLIAAAPALYEALAALVENPHSSSAWSMADAALSAATNTPNAGEKK